MVLKGPKSAKKKDSIVAELKTEVSFLGFFDALDICILILWYFGGHFDLFKSPTGLIWDCYQAIYVMKVFVF